MKSEVWKCDVVLTDSLNVIIVRAERVQLLLQ